MILLHQLLKKLNLKKIINNLFFNLPSNGQENIFNIINNKSIMIN